MQNDDDYIFPRLVKCYTIAIVLAGYALLVGKSVREKLVVLLIHVVSNQLLDIKAQCQRQTVKM